MLATLRQRLRDPVLWTNAFQIVKTVAAAVIAWVLAVHVFHIAQAFLAPWAALLTVHELPEGFWPVCGALLVNLRNILEALGPVADAQPVEVPAPALTTLRRRTAAGAVVRSAGE